MILECHSRGDRRFSALYARLASGHTIEQIYQNSKRDEQKQPYAHPKGKHPAYMYIANEYIDMLEHPEVQKWFYWLLWHVYFLERDDLRIEASQYNGFRDIFDGRQGFVYTPEMTYPNHGGCCQSAAIAWCVKRQLGIGEEVPEIVLKSLDKYWKRYHPLRC